MGKLIDLDALEREMTNRAESRARSGVNLNLWSEPDRREAHFFLGEDTMSLCGRLELSERLIDPHKRLAREREAAPRKVHSLPYCRTCWQRFAMGQGRR